MQKTQTICLVILTVIAVSASLHFLKSVLLPFIIALFFVIGIRPILTLLEHKLGVNRWIAFAVTLTLSILLVVGFVATVWLSIRDLSQNSGAYEQRLATIALWLERSLGGEYGSSTSEIPKPPVRESSDAASDETDEKSTDEKSQAIAHFMQYLSESLQAQMFQFAAALSSLLSYGILILIFVFFLLLGNEKLSQDPPELVREVESQVRRYLVMKTFISAITGFAFGFVLWLFGVPLAILLGFLAFLLNFIPNIGPLISTLTPLPFLVLNSEISPLSAVSCFALVSAIQFVSGNVAEPRIMGKSFDVSPVFLLLALMFFGLVWGIIGMFLATPIASILKIILQGNATTRPLSELMAGRWR